jgi:hypothetical protein
MASTLGTSVSTSENEPWYRNPDAWLVAAVVFLPFGWVLGVCRLVWVYGWTRRRKL